MFGCLSVRAVRWVKYWDRIGSQISFFCADSEGCQCCIDCSCHSGWVLIVALDPAVREVCVLRGMLLANVRTTTCSVARTSVMFRRLHFTSDPTGGIVEFWCSYRKVVVPISEAVNFTSPFHIWPRCLILFHVSTQFEQSNCKARFPATCLEASYPSIPILPS